jgi:hypothetical protein
MWIIIIHNPDTTGTMYLNHLCWRQLHGTLPACALRSFYTCWIMFLYSLMMPWMYQKRVTMFL